MQDRFLGTHAPLGKAQEAPPELAHLVNSYGLWAPEPLPALPPGPTVGGGGHC